MGWRLLSPINEETEAQGDLVTPHGHVACVHQDIWGKGELKPA